MHGSSHQLCTNNINDRNQNTRPLVDFNNQPLGWQLKVVTDCAMETSLTGCCTFFLLNLIVYKKF